MTYTIKINDILKEKIYINTLSSGTKCYIIPKKRFEQVYAAAVFSFGAENIVFSRCGLVKELPLGTAHFLEHKMFESSMGNVMDDFIKNGADPNAFTDYKKTAYHFSCNKKDFYGNFKRLLSFVFRPGFTEGSIESEKSIITQEILMYKDSPARCAFVNLMECLFKEYPFRFDVAGDEESVKNIDEADLLSSFNGFYKPSNMSIVCVGDVDPKRINDIARDLIIPDRKPEAKKLFKDEPEEISKEYNEMEMGISKPLFNIGFKEKNSFEENKVKKFYGMKILMECLFGKGSEFFKRLYNKGVLKEALEFQYLRGHVFSSAIIGGRAESPSLIKEEIMKEIEEKSHSGIDICEFKRVMKMELGRFIRGFDYPESLFMSQIELAVMGTDLLEAFNEVSSIDIEYLEKIMKDVLREEKMALSVIK